MMRISLLPLTESPNERHLPLDVLLPVLLFVLLWPPVLLEDVVGSVVLEVRSKFVVLHPVVWHFLLPLEYSQVNRALLFVFLVSVSKLQVNRLRFSVGRFCNVLPISRDWLLLCLILGYILRLILTFEIVRAVVGPDIIRG